LMVSVTPAAPAVAEEGDRLVILGGPFGEELPPPPPQPVVRGIFASTRPTTRSRQLRSAFLI
jgi:hypothetical protein